MEKENNGYEKEFIEAIKVLVEEMVKKNSTQIYNGVCVSVSGSTCTMLINGRNQNVKYYGNTPTVNANYRVFVPNDNMSIAFIICP